MYKKLFVILFLGLYSSMVLSAAPKDCRSLVFEFMQKSNNQQNSSMIKNGWHAHEKKKFLKEVEALGFSDSHIKVMIESLNMNTHKVSIERVKKYLSYVLSLSDEQQKIALLDIAQLDAREINSKYVKKFVKHEDKLNRKFESGKMSLAEQKRYQDLYYGCRALRPNEVNKNAAKDFKRFNLSLNLGSLGASYAFYNMDKEKDGAWFGELGYDIGITLLFSYVGGNIQTKATDNQIVKSLKSYFMGRLLGVTDIVLYDPLFNNEREKAEAHLEELKKNPEFKKEIEKLLIKYKERHLYTQYKHKIIDTLKNLPDGISLGLKGNSVDENNVDWNNLTHADLDRPEVQEVLIAASMAHFYEESKGEWIQTGDVGLDRYAFNAGFYAAQIPKSIIQNYITYQMLCMGQDQPKLAFTKAVMFNVAANFAVNQVLYGYREKAINQ